MDKNLNTVLFTDLDLQMNDEVSVFTFKDKDIEVKKYLPIEDKYDLISIVLQNSYENGHFNEVKLDMYFNLYIVYLYTNLEFTDIQKDNPAKLYDILESTHFIDAVVSAMDAEEYNYLYETLIHEAEKVTKYNNTMASVLNSFIQNLPKNAKEAKEIIDQFDPDAFTNVMAFVKAANGNRPIQ